MPLEYYLINAAIGVVFAIPPVVYSLIIKVKKLALLYGVFCILVTTIAGWFFGLIMCGLAMFWTYKMHLKIKDAQEKKNRVAFQKRMEEEQAVSPKIDEKKAQKAWPPIQNQIIDEDAAREFVEWREKQDNQ